MQKAPITLPCTSFTIDDVVPYEIKARGLDAVRHFQTACDTGTTSVRRTLLLLIGPKSSGKTTLKQVLVSTNDTIDM
jgi:polynucleotide 5'-kinase involved in rRNA processing